MAQLASCRDTERQAVTPIVDRYQWLIRRLNDEFGEGHIKYHVYDYGHALNIAYIGANGRLGFHIEMYIRGPTNAWDEDGEPIGWEPGHTYALNNFPHKDVVVDDLIKRIGSIHHRPTQEQL